MSDAPQQPAQPPAAQPPAADAAVGEQKGPSKSELKKQAKEAEKAKKAAERKAKEDKEKAERDAANVDYAADKYGDIEPVGRPKPAQARQRGTIASLAGKSEGEKVYLRARVQTSRTAGAKLIFLTLRDNQASTVQAMFNVAPDAGSKQMVKWASSIPNESLVIIEGELQKPQEPVKSCSVQDVEIRISTIFVEGRAPQQAPISFIDASRPEEDFAQEDAQFVRVNLDTRLDHRVIDLRTPTNRSIFRIQSAVSQLFREFLQNKGFIEIHSPKLQGAATESGSSVFEVKYFNGKAFLAQSPQFAKQMCIAADMGRVYEVGPVFRAENSNTPRHMTEFVGLDLEMEINEHYHEVLDTLDGLFLHIFQTLKEKFATEIDLIRKQHPSEEFLLPDGPTLRLNYKEATQLLRDSGVEIGEEDDMSTEQEKKLGAIIREKHKTDYYIIDQFPAAIRPFYTQPSPENPRLSNSYDFFMRGQEILSGAQRVHDAGLLEKQMKAVGVDVTTEGVAGYLEAFKSGCPPHGGGGIGLERVVQFYLNLGDIRRASLFPRDPKRLAP